VEDSEYSFFPTAHYSTIGGALRFVIKAVSGVVMD
jgi:hypothetical protein